MDNIIIKLSFIKKAIKKGNRKFYYNKTINRINESLKTITDYKIINNLEIGSIQSILDKVNFDSLYTTEHTNFHGDFILDNIIKTKTSYKLLDWRQNFGGDLLLRNI